MNKYINYIFFLFYLFSRPRLFLLLFKKIYLPIFIQYEWLKEYKINTIIDIGANHGDVSNVLQNIFPKAKIYAFEPIKKEYEIIKRKINQKNFIVENIGLSNKIGESVFFVNEFSPSSSLLKLSNNARKKIPGLGKEKMIKVKLTTLDAYFSNKKLKQKIFLKIDIQGAEKLVLEGGINFLKQVSIIHIETSFSKIYKNQCMFSDIYRLLTNFGFKYVGNVRDSEFYPNFTIDIQQNSIFIRKFI